MKPRNSVAVGVAAGLLFISLVVYFTSSLAILQAPDDFSPTNTSWNGMSAFVSTANPSLLQNLTALPANGEGFVLMEVGPTIAFNAHEGTVVSAFVNSGGTLVVADDFGSGNSLLRGMGLASRFNGSLLADPLFNFHNPWLIVVPRIEMTNVSGLAFNYGTTLSVSDPKARILGFSSDFSYISPTEPGSPTASAPRGPFPVLAEVPYGHGQVFLISDASLFINSMLDRDGNLALLKDLATAPVLLDASHLTVGPATLVRNFEQSVYSLVSVPEFKYAVVLLAFVAIVAYRSGETAPEGGDELKQVQQDHPEWDQKRLAKLKEDMERNE